MDSFTDVLATFLDLYRVNYIAGYGRVRELLICVPKINRGLNGLERTEGEWVMTEFSFLGEPSL